MFLQIVFVALLLLVLGLALCFAGYRLFVVLLPVYGFFAGLLLTAQVIQELFGAGFLATAGSWVFGFVVGVLCALAAYFFFILAVAVLAATVGYELGVGILAGLGVSSGVLLFIAGFVFAAVLTAAVLVFNVPKLLIVVLTAASGAGMVLTGILLALGRIPLEGLQWGVVGDFIRASWFWSLVFLVLAALGVFAQLKLPEDYALEPYSQVGTAPGAPAALQSPSPPNSGQPAV
jgi:hypothetical protein